MHDPHIDARTDRVFRSYGLGSPELAYYIARGRAIRSKTATGLVRSGIAAVRGLIGRN